MFDFHHPNRFVLRIPINFKSCYQTELKPIPSIHITNRNTIFPFVIVYGFAFLPTFTFYSLYYSEGIHSTIPYFVYVLMYGQVFVHNDKIRDGFYGMLSIAGFILIKKAFQRN